MRIQTRLLLFTSALVLVTATVVGGIGYKIGAAAFRGINERFLMQVRDQKAQELKNEIESIGNGLRTLSELTAARNTIPNLAKDYKELSQQIKDVPSTAQSEVSRYYSPSLQPEFLRALAKMPNTAIYMQWRYIHEAKEKDVPVRDIVSFRDPSSYRIFKGIAAIHPLLHDFAQQYHLEDLVLIDTSGQVLYTVEKSFNFGTNLAKGVLSSSPLAQAYRWSLSASPRNYQVFDLAPQSSFVAKNSLWISVPVYDETRLLGSLVAQVAESRIQEILRQDGSAEVLLLGKYDSPPNLKSLQTSTRVSVPGVDWVLVSKLRDDGSQPSLARFSTNVILFLAPVLLLLLLIAFLFSRRMVRPLHQLSSSLENFGSGNKIPYQGHDEFEPIVSQLNQLSESQDTTKRLQKFLADGIAATRAILFVVDEAQRIQLVSDTTAEMLGVSSSSLKGTELKMWLDLGSEKLNSKKRQEAQLRSISGKAIPIEIGSVEVEDTRDNKHKSIVITGVDITLQKKLQKEVELKEMLFKELQSASHVGSFRRDIVTGETIWSEETFKIFGLDPKKVRPSYQLYRSFILPEDLITFDQAAEVSHKEMKPFSIDVRARRADTLELIWLRCTARNDFDDYGNPVVTYGTIQDITEMKRGEQSLIAAKNEALKSSQAKSEFLARMSHEIRTPMNAIMGMADLLKETKLSEDQQYYVTIFCKAGEVLMALINDILDLSKIEAGEVSLENIPFDMEKLLTDIQDIMRPRAMEKGLEYSFEISPQVNPHLLGDPTKIRQVLINLISNSVKFTERGSIRVTLGRNPSKKDHLLISVNDTGLGIPQSKQHLIFQKFSQADSTITRRYGGTGLGLAISKSLVELMGGQIWFKSREGVGTSFFITIPYHEQIAHPVTHKPIPMQAGKLDFVAKRERDPNRKLRILLADDTEDNRILFIRYLSREPFEIVEAENGLEAIDKIKSEKFDIIFMDVQMPELDGYATTARIREWEDSHHQEHTPIIALTAHALSEDRAKSIKAGCDDHITKPFKKNTILSVIEKYS
ncbi:ATP-binding protein [Bdellovibrio sp. HCB2-146]|uniref:ATP-binding protein n=1 Tax=Bdellovibrio sp. HCB2-146 TaxID=3394362 RepID=UPI0039BD35E5